MKPVNYLDLLKKHSAKVWGIDAPGFSDEMKGLRESLLKTLPGSLKDKFRDIYSRLPSVSDRADILSDLIKGEIQELVSSKDWKRLAKVPVGILLSPELNGFAVRVPSGGQIVVLNAGLIGILHGVNKTLMKLTVAEEEESDAPDIDLAIELVNRLPKFAMSAITQNQEKPPALLPVGRGQFTIANIYTNIQELFCFAHEYSHVLLGHLDRYESNTKLFGKSMSVDTYTIEQMQEFEADRNAAKIIFKTRHGDPNMQAIAITILFNFISLCESLSGEHRDLPPTHPPAEMRKKKLLEFYADSLHEGGRMHIQQMDTIFEASVM